MEFWKNITLKQKLVLILGIVYYLVFACMQIEHLVYEAPRLYVYSTFLQYTAMITSMQLITFKRKTPALVLVICAVVLCLINQYVLTYGTVDPFYRTLYYMLEYIILIAYILIDGRHKKDSIIWCCLFLVAVGYSVYEVAKILSLMDLVFLTLYLSFYLVGYSPEKWYEHHHRHFRRLRRD